MGPQERRSERTATREILLCRSGLVFVGERQGTAGERFVRAVEVRLAALGYVLSTRLASRLGRLPLDRLAHLSDWLWSVLAAARGADRKHEPLFRRFPDGVPLDTHELWERKVLSHYLQGADQPCLFCGKVATCHVLSPCHHVACDRCFDGSSYSACPVCEHQVDRSSPFFAPAPARRPSRGETVRLTRLDLGGDLDEEARALLVSLCARGQALSPDDGAALRVVVRDFREEVLEWLPATIPVKENRALVFGTLLQLCEPGLVLPAARRHLATATDVLRLVAAMSGADPALQGETIVRTVKREDVRRTSWRRITQALGVPPPPPATIEVSVPVKVNRFRVARLSRPLRRTLLDVLEGLEPDRLVEDMLRHRSYWVWVGQLLHPTEYAARFPRVARAFQVVRKKGPDGIPAPAFHGFASRVEAAARAKDAPAMTGLLRQRPGELARRLDHALRVAGEDAAAVGQLVDAFAAAAPGLGTPLLLTLRSALPTRTSKVPVRVFWPKGQTGKGVSAPDARPPLAPEVVERAVEAVEDELLRRFGARPPFRDAVVDAGLKAVVAPFNERTASPSAVALPRGSRLAVPSGKLMRLFLHWCEPERGGRTTDLDLSIGFYDERWRNVGVCSYYQLRTGTRDGLEIAASAGDRRDAPYPDGATELVDLHVDRALAAGFRYAVMVVNAYAGLPFSQLERSFAGLMLRDDAHGDHFDPRTVELRFALRGESGVYLPLVVDLAQGTLHWLDVFSRGKLAFNNAESSSPAVAKICPDLMAHFGSGVRASMYDVALLHAAARAQRVFVRDGAAAAQHTRQAGETARAFLRRIRGGAADAREVALPGPDGPPLLAALLRGDVALPAGSLVYALFHEGLTGTIAAGDLVA